MSSRCEVDFGDQDRIFSLKTHKRVRTFPWGQPTDFRVQEQLLEVSVHLIAEDGEETGIHGA